jgi:hypothetical protein
VDDSDDDEYAATYQSAFYEEPLENYFNTQYYGSMYLGSESEEIEFIFDTGTPYLWVATEKCRKKCHTNDLYDTQQSESYH